MQCFKELAQSQGGHASAPTGAAEREGRLQAQEAASQTQVAAHLGEVAESTLGQNRDPLGGGTLKAGSVAEPSEAHSACRRRRRRSYWVYASLPGELSEGWVPSSVFEPWPTSGQAQADDIRQLPPPPTPSSANSLPHQLPQLWHA